MEAEIFYQTGIIDAIPIIFLTKNDASPKTNTVPSDELSYLWKQDFLGNCGEICITGHPEIEKIYVGLGDGDDATALAVAVNRLPAGRYFIDEPLSAYASLIWSLSQYRFDRYKACLNKPRVLCFNTDSLRDEVLAKANAVFLVRDLINTPTSDMGPKEMADALSAVAQTHEGSFEQWIGDELLANNFPAIHAVGRAAAAPPRLLSLTFGDETLPKITLIGKGVCFDSGGLDLKSSSNMRLMKKDMGGAAQVIGLADWIMAKKLPVHLTVLIPAVENAIGSRAYRPGDVLTMRNGLTVEIENTDAEGRLVVADALVKACEEEPDLIIDFTTLTGAARIAVGTEISAFFTNNDQLATALQQCANETHDAMWRMPLHVGYECMLDSTIAHLSNASASSYAGAITAALFLKRFITQSTDWIHIDTMAWNLSNKPGKPEGGEAMGMRAIAHYLEQRFLASSVK